VNLIKTLELPIGDFDKNPAVTKRDTIRNKTNRNVTSSVPVLFFSFPGRQH
jgi:hypothetical protein